MLTSILSPIRAGDKHSSADYDNDEDNIMITIRTMMTMTVIMMRTATMTMIISQVCQAAAPRQPVYLQKQVTSFH